MKKILIAGQDSYIGSCLERYLLQRGEYFIKTVDMRNDGWKSTDFSHFDCVFFTAGIVHRKKFSVKKNEYYRVNAGLPELVGQLAKENGVRQFIFMSTMSVYGNREGIISSRTAPKPSSLYGKSKYEGECRISRLHDDNFNVYILRPPMVYGRGCPGNYNVLSGFVKKVRVIPLYKNERSMIYIDNLCYFIKRIIDGELEPGVWLPQNSEYVNTTEMAELIAAANGFRLYKPSFLGGVITICRHLKIDIVLKCFGSYRYAKENSHSVIDGVSLSRSVYLTEGRESE